MNCDPENFIEWRKHLSLDKDYKKESHSEIVKSFDNFIMMWLSKSIMKKTNIRDFKIFLENYDSSILEIKDTSNKRLINYAILHDEEPGYYFFIIENMMKAKNLFKKNPRIDIENIILACNHKKLLFFKSTLKRIKDVDMRFHPDTQPDKPITLLLHCVKYKLTDFILPLLNKGADPYILYSETIWKKFNSFFLSIEKDSWEILKILVENCKRKPNFTALMFTCVSKNSYLCLRYLLSIKENIENINKKNKFGETLLFKSLKLKRAGITDFLSDKGADVNIANSNGIMPIHIVTEDFTTLKIVKRIMIDQRNKENVTNYRLRKILCLGIDVFWQNKESEDVIKKFVERFPGSLEFPKDMTSNNIVSASYDPLAKSIFYNMSNIVKFLIKKGINTYYLHATNFLFDYIKRLNDNSVEVLEYLLKELLWLDSMSPMEKEDCIDILLTKNKIPAVKKLQEFGFKFNVNTECVCGIRCIDHVEDPVEKERIIENDKSGKLIVCLREKSYENYIHHINKDNTIFWSPEIEELRDYYYKTTIKEEKFLAKAFLSPWSPQFNKVYKKEKRELAKLLMLIQKRVEPKGYNYDIFIHIISHLISFESRSPWL